MQKSALTKKQYKHTDILYGSFPMFGLQQISKMPQDSNVEGITLKLKKHAETKATVNMTIILNI